MRKSAILAAILVGVVLLLPFDVRAEGENSVGRFTDVSDRHWAKAAINQAVEQGYASGYPDGTFRPDKNITRAEVASIMDRVTKLKTGTNLFVLPDMDQHWSKESVRRLTSMGIISAADYSKGFEPNKPITRYELMKWMASGLAASDPSFKKALADTKDTLLPTPESFNGSIKATQIPYIALVRGTGIITGYSDGSLKPSGQATRAEVLTMIMKYAKIEGSNADSYRDLQEMIGVSLEGTNMLQLTDDVRFMNGSLNMKEFSKKTINVPSADVVIHRMIFVDARTSKYKGVYAKLFTDGGNDRVGRYEVIYEATITSKREKFNTDSMLRVEGDINKFGNAFAVNTFSSFKFDQNIIPVIPRTGAEDVIKKGVPYTFWTPYSIKDEDERYNLLTFKDYYFGYGIWDKGE